MCRILIPCFSPLYFGSAASQLHAVCRLVHSLQSQTREGLALCMLGLASTLWSSSTVVTHLQHLADFSCQLKSFVQQPGDLLLPELKDYQGLLVVQKRLAQAKLWDSRFLCKVGQN